MPRANGITRQEILLALKCNGAMTAEDLHHSLGISQVAVRQHLAALEAEGSVTVRAERRGLGRPTHRYALTPAGDETFPRCYDQTANALLEELRSWQGEEAVLALFERRRDRIQSQLASHLSDKPLPAKLNELARRHTENGFMAETCQVGDDAYVLIKRNCAMNAVARNHPALCCQGEEALLQNLLNDAEVRCEQTIVNGGHYCRFHIQAKAASEE